MESGEFKIDLCVSYGRQIGRRKEGDTRGLGASNMRPQMYDRPVTETPVDWVTAARCDVFGRKLITE